MTLGGPTEQVLEAIPMNIIDICRNNMLRERKNAQQAHIQQEHIQQMQNHQQANNVNEQRVQNIPRPINNPPTVLNTPQQVAQIQYFKDSMGNEFKLENGVLYSKGWFNSKLKFRLLNTKTNKIIPIDGKNLQIYGWSKVETVTIDKNSVNDDVIIDDVENEIITENEDKNQPSDI